MGLFAGGNPFNSTTGVLTLFAGADYKAADGNAAVFTNAAGNWQSLAGASILLAVFNNNLPLAKATSGGVIPPSWFPPPLIAPLAGSVIVPTGAGQQVSIDIPSASTSVRPCASPTDLYSFALSATLADGNTVPLWSGPCNILGAGS
jgi:hypothetical protein